MWQKRGRFNPPPPPMKGCFPLLSKYLNGLFQKKTKQGRGVSRTNLFENPLKFLGFSFTPGNSKQCKASHVEIP